jgi:TolB-like protein
MGLKMPVILLVVGSFFLGYGTLYAADTLEKAIEKQADYIVDNSPRDTMLAIVSIKSDSGLLSEYIMEKLPDYVINNKKNITFVDRSKLDLIQREINFQYSGEVSDETMISIGKKLGAQFIVTGTIMEASTVYNFSIKVLDVETTQILGSNSTQITHDNTMAGFMSGSGVAQSALEKTQQKRQQREAAVSTIKNALGIFSDGLYFGYLGSLGTPIGISFGTIHDKGRLGYFIETGFGPPSFEGHERSDDLSYNGNALQDQTPGFTYTNENKRTAFVWDLLVGVNFNVVKTLLWLNVGAGFEYRQDYKLFTETSSGGSNEVWVKNGSSAEKFRPVVSAGLYVKLWYFYIQGKYKYVVSGELDSSNYGLNHFNLGIGYVWRTE